MITGRDSPMKKPTFLQQCKAAAENSPRMARLLEMRSSLVRLNTKVPVVEALQQVEVYMREEL